MKLLRSTALLLALPLTVFAAHKQPLQSYIFTAHLDKDQVAHRLLPASRADSAPHPFYTRYCNRHSFAHRYPNASGSAILQYLPERNLIKFAVTYQGLSGPAIMAHIHVGNENVGGPIDQTICGNPPPGNDKLGYSALPAAGQRVCPRGRHGFITGQFRVVGNKNVPEAFTRKKVLRALMRSRLYFNFHTCLNQPGEIRGQITPLI